MSLETQRKIAARVMKCGASRVWLDPERISDIEEAITAADIRRLVKDGAVRKEQKKGVSRSRKSKIARQKSRGRRKGHGSKKGSLSGGKKEWVKRIRVLRKMLREFRSQRRIENRTYRELYMKSKSGFFRSRGHLMTYMERNNLLKKAEEK
ncbi:MAG: 50S ribosomal protein L19e [Candidatus Aenigmarchaeota archaeon]|nr:50S ribosomal protein L19e [Candidatus Aenigmarchaeota archaeon]